MSVVVSTPLSVAVSRKPSGRPRESGFAVTVDLPAICIAGSTVVSDPAAAAPVSATAGAVRSGARLG